MIKSFCPILLPLPVCKLLDFKVTSLLITLGKAAKLFSSSLVHQIFLAINTAFVSLVKIFSLKHYSTFLQLHSFHKYSNLQSEK